MILKTKILTLIKMIFGDNFYLFLKIKIENKMHFQTILYNQKFTFTS